MGQTTTLDPAVSMLLGTAEVMASVGRCFNYAWHAAHEGNWQLAAYFLRRTRKLLRGEALVRSKYAGQIEDFEAKALANLLEAAGERDWATFEERFRLALELTDRYHVATGHPYIRWRPEARPPTDLDLGPM
jgi:hypothetical protein